MFQLLKKASAAAGKESEKIDLINRLAVFAKDNGSYFNEPVYDVFEEKLVAIIEYANSYDYDYDVFRDMYDDVCVKFSMACDWYVNEINSKPLLSVLIPNCPELQKEFRLFIDDLREFYINTIEVVFINNTGDETADLLTAIQQCAGRVVLPIEGNMVINEFVLKELLELVRNNPAMGFFMDLKYSQFERDMTRFITILKPEEQTGLVEIELTPGSFGFRKDVFNFGDMLNGHANTPIQNIQALYSTMFYAAAKELETVLFNSCLIDKH